MKIPFKWPRFTGEVIVLLLIIAAISGPFWALNRSPYTKVEAGQSWTYGPHKDPFLDYIIIDKVLEVKSGWVRYSSTVQYNGQYGAAEEHHCSISDFLGPVTGGRYRLR